MFMLAGSKELPNLLTM